MTQFNLLVGDADGSLIEVAELRMAGMELVKPLPVPPDAVIDLPAGLPLEVLPGRVAMGYDEDLGRSVRLHEYQGRRVFPVGAILSTPIIQQLRPAFTTELDAGRLTGKSIAAVGCCEGSYIVAALCLPVTATRPLLLPLSADGPTEALEMLQQIGSEERAAQTICLDALSGSIPDAMLAELIGSLRPKIGGTLQLLHHGNKSQDLAGIAGAGIDEFLFPVNSLQEEYYNAFFAKKGGSLNELSASVSAAQEAGARVALQYQSFPGLTDHPREFQHLLDWTDRNAVKTLYVSDLAVDPEWYIEELLLSRQERNMFGMREWWQRIQTSGLQIHPAASESIQLQGKD